MKKLRVLLSLDEEDVKRLERIKLYTGESYPSALRRCLYLQSHRMSSGLEGSPILSLREGGNLRRLIEDIGVAVPDDLSDFFEVPVSWIRKWAKNNGVPRAGTAFHFDFDLANKLGQSIANSYVAGKNNDRPRVIKTLGQLIDKTIGERK